MKIVEIKFSLTPIKTLLIFFAIGPWYGLFTTHLNQDQHLGLFVSRDLLITFTIYTIALIITTIGIKNNIIFTNEILSKKLFTKILNQLTFAATIIFIIVFLFAGIHTLTGELNRGEVRVNTGLFGPLYTLAILYIPALVTFFATILFFNSAQVHKTYRIFFIYSLIFGSSFMTGAKLTTVLVFLPTISIFWAYGTLQRKLILIIISILIVITSHILFSKESITLADSFSYNIARSTYIAAYGVMASWDYAHSTDFDSIPILFNSIFGNQITTILFSSSGVEIDPVKMSIHKLITYEYYPDKEAALAGTVNLTLTIFGELILYMKEYWFIGLLFFLIFYFLILRKMVCAFSKRRNSLGVILLLYNLIIISSIINSGLILQTIALTTIIYMIISYIIMKSLIPQQILDPHC